MYKKSLLLLLIIIMIFCGCDKNMDYESETANMVITVLDTKPKSKCTTNVEIVEHVIELISNFKKTEIPFENRKGWQIMIAIKKENTTDLYSICGNIHSINDKNYHCDTDNLKEQLIEIYNEMPEETEEKYEK